MVDFEKMNKEAKAMKYSIEPITKVARDGMMSDGGTEKKAAALEGKWIRLNEHEYILEEVDKATRVFIDEDMVGCACGRCNDGILCEHILAFEALKSPPQLSIKSPDCDWLSGYLMSPDIKWASRDGYLYSPESQEPEVVAELPPIGESSGLPEDEDEPTKLDPVNGDKPLDIGVEEDKPLNIGVGDAQEPLEDTPSATDPVSEDVTLVHYECPKCGAIVDIEPDKLNDWKLNHMDVCTGKKADKQKSPRLVTPEEHEPVVKESSTTEKSTVEESAPIEKPLKKEEKKVKPPSKKTVSLYDWIEELVEFGVGQIFGESGEGKTALCRELAVRAADEGKKVIYWDSEGNMTRNQRAAMTKHKNIEYILDRDWEEIRHMLPVTGEDDRTGPSIYAKTPKLKKCDLFILDSIGVPVLGIYGDMLQNEKGAALQGMQGLAYRLTTWAEKNEAVVIMTNQPVSAMNKTKAQIADRPPFGDKMKYFTKEIMKMVIAKRTEYATICNLVTWRTRDDKRGKILATVTISDNGVEVTPTESG